MSRERIAGVVALVGAVILLPVAAWAQGSAIAGVVRDSTGGVLPGVTVEAASPVLIEKVRTAVTDDQGFYRIVCPVALPRSACSWISDGRPRGRKRCPDTHAFPPKLRSAGVFDSCFREFRRHALIRFRPSRAKGSER